MALVVPPASPADSYISLVDAATYHTARGNAAWAALASDTVREQLLIKATDYLTATYGAKWKGERVDGEQLLDWPRSCVYAHGYVVPDDIVPVIVGNACAILALKASTVALMPDVGRLKSRVKVGPIETEYVNGASALTRFTEIDRMLKPYLNGGGGSISLVRA
jgi:hypothetical protein